MTMASTAAAVAALFALAIQVALVAEARPGQTVLDASDPTESEGRSEAHEGGEVPVQLVYDHEGGEEEERLQREAGGGQEEAKKKSRLLSLEERENDENAKYGLGIQSRNRASEAAEAAEATGDGEGELMKPFVYNIQPLSYYSTETKEQESIINYINRIKEMRQNQIKYKGDTGKQEDAVVTEAQPEAPGPVTRKIQHVQIVIKPPEVTQAYYRQPNPPAPPLAYGYPPQPAYGYPYPPQQTVVYSPSAATRGIWDYLPSRNPLQDYFPIVVHDPFNTMYMAMSSIVEYGPEADVCRTKQEQPTSRKFGLGGGGGGVKEGAESWPKWARVKVRRGGVAIAGPGGIATAGSGGTAIVGPGGTAYTTRDGTAVVGPGGRVVHVPSFPLYADGVDAKDGEGQFVPPEGARTVAEGPVVYLDDDHDDDVTTA